MAINEWKIWQRLGFKSPPKQSKIDVNKDIDAVLDSLNDVKPVISSLIKDINKFKALKKQEKSRKNISDNELKKMTEEKVKVFDRILNQYEYYELDVDVNGERIKNISSVLGKKAKDFGISKKWLNKIKNSERWTFDW
ncbi:hypothetical protein GF361_03675 [Candidatus Woesearchaeota archaeon]|nr:hypothetical protein [Candidatus Woesearchaeota archaeon]